MTKGRIGISHYVNKYKCGATGVHIASKCAYRLHKKKCQMCATTPLPQSELLGKHYTMMEKASDQTFVQRDEFIYGPWK